MLKDLNRQTLELASLMILVGLMVFSLSAFIPWFRPEMGNALLSSILTASLVFLYFKQTNIQDSQTKIMERQEEMMKESHRPIIDTESLKPYAPGLFQEKAPNSLTISLINVGNGVAVDPSVSLDIDFEHEDIEIERSISPIIRLEHTTGENLNQSSLSNTLPPNGEEKQFRVSPDIHVKKSDGEKVLDLPTTLEMLNDEGVDQFHFEMSVVVSDITGERHDFEMMSFDANLQEMKDWAPSLKEVIIGDKEEPSVVGEDEFAYTFCALFFYGVLEESQRMIPDSESTHARPWSNKMPQIAYSHIVSGILGSRLFEDDLEE